MKKRIKDSLIERYEMISQTIEKLEERIRLLPDGKIKIRHVGNGVYYYQVNEDSTETLLKDSDKKYIEDLLQKNYLERVVKAFRQELTVLNRTIKQYPETIAEEVYYHLSDSRKDIVKPIVPTDEQFAKRWQEKPFTPKKIEEGTPVFLTMKGERVRSKSEVIIADRLFLNGIPYKYECPLNIKKYGKTITIHPDFTILKISERRILYLEHCGKMDDPQYTESKVVKRTNDYNLAGIVLGDSLFLTFESSSTPLDVRTLDNLISRHFK